MVTTDFARQGRSVGPAPLANARGGNAASRPAAIVPSSAVALATEAAGARRPNTARRRRSRGGVSGGGVSRASDESGIQSRVPLIQPIAPLNDASATPMMSNA